MWTSLIQEATEADVAQACQDAIRPHMLTTSLFITNRPNHPQQAALFGTGCINCSPEKEKLLLSFSLATQGSFCR